MGNYYTKAYFYNAIDGQNEEWIIKIAQKHPNYLNEPMTHDCQTVPLSRSAWRGDTKIVDLLIKLGAKVDYAGPTNVTPIMWASKRGHDKLILKLMNEYKANSELTTDYGFNMLDFAISHGCYKTALMIMNNTKLTPKTPDEYRAHSEKNQIMWFDYEIMVDHLNLKVESEMVPVFNQKPDLRPILIDPVVDPTETWNAYFARVLEFQDPPMIERNQLPENLQPQNSLKGKLRQYWHGLSPYPDNYKQSSQLQINDDQNDDKVFQRAQSLQQLSKKPHFDQETKKETKNKSINKNSSNFEMESLKMIQKLQNLNIDDNMNKIPEQQVVQQKELLQQDEQNLDEQLQDIKLNENNENQRNYMKEDIYS